MSSVFYGKVYIYLRHKPEWKGSSLLLKWCTKAVKATTNILKINLGFQLYLFSSLALPFCSFTIVYMKYALSSGLHFTRREKPLRVFIVNIAVMVICHHSIYLSGSSVLSLVLVSLYNKWNIWAVTTTLQIRPKLEWIIN